MTLILAMTCDDGVVIGADSAMSESDIGTKIPVSKIKQVAQAPILYGISGDVGLTQKIDIALAKYTSKTSKTSLPKARQVLKSLIVPVLIESSKDHVPYPEQPRQLPPPAIVLFAGVLEEKPWILEIEKDASDTLYDEAMGGFCAIGSGKFLAHAIFRPHLNTKRDLRTGKVCAFRVLDDAINLASHSLAPPLNIHEIGFDGEVRKIDKDGMQQLRETVGLWRNMEREALGRALSPEQNTPETPIPKPGNGETVAASSQDAKSKPKPHGNR